MCDRAKPFWDGERRAGYAVDTDMHERALPDQLVTAEEPVSAAKRGPPDVLHASLKRDEVIEVYPCKETALTVHNRNSGPVCQESRERVSHFGEPFTEPSVHPAQKCREVNLGDVHFAHDDAARLGVEVGTHPTQGSAHPQIAVFTCQLGVGVG